MLNRLYMAEKALTLLRSGNDIPHPEPHSSVKSQWDFLLQEMAWMSKDYYEERRWKVHAARRLSQMVQNYWRRKMLNLERHVSSKCSALIQSFWLGIADHVDPQLVPADLKPYTMVVQPASVGEDGQASASKRRLFNYCVRQFEQGMYECERLTELVRTSGENSREKSVENVSGSEIPNSPMSIDIDHDEGCQWVVDEELLQQLDPLVFVKKAVPQATTSADAMESDHLSAKGGSGSSGGSSAGTSGSGASGASNTKSSPGSSAASRYLDVSDLFKEFSGKQEAVVDLNDHRRYLDSWADTVQVLLQGPGVINTRSEYRPPNPHLDSKNYLVAPRLNFVEMEDISLILSLFVLAVDNLPAFLNRYIISSPSNVVYRSSGGMVSGSSSHESIANEFSIESKRKSRRRATSNAKKMSGIIPSHIPSSASIPHFVSGGVGLPPSSVSSSAAGVIGGGGGGGAMSASTGISGPPTVPIVADQTTSFDILAYADTWDTSEDIILVYFVSQYSCVPGGVSSKQNNVASVTNWSLIALSHNYFFNTLYGRMKTAKQCQERWVFLNREEAERPSVVEPAQKNAAGEEKSEDPCEDELGSGYQGEQAAASGVGSRGVADALVKAETSESGNCITKSDIDRLMSREKGIRMVPNLNRRYVVDVALMKRLKDFSGSLGSSGGGGPGADSLPVDGGESRQSFLVRGLSRSGDGTCYKTEHTKKRMIPRMSIVDLIEGAGEGKSRSESQNTEPLPSLGSGGDQSEAKCPGGGGVSGGLEEGAKRKSKGSRDVKTVGHYQREQLQQLSSIVSKFGANMRKRSLQNQQFQDSFQITSYLQTIQQNYGPNILQDGVLPPHQSHANLVAHVNQMLNQHIESTMVNNCSSNSNINSSSNSVGGANNISSSSSSSMSAAGGGGPNMSSNNAGTIGANGTSMGSNVVGGSGGGGGPGAGNTVAPSQGQDNSGTQVGTGTYHGSSNFTPLPSGIPPHLLAPGNLPPAASVEEYLSRLPGIDIQLKLIDYSLDRYRQSTMGGRYGGTGILMSTSSTCRKPQLPEFLLQRSVINSGANSGIVGGGQQGAGVHGPGQHVGMSSQQGMIHPGGAGGGAGGGGVGGDQQIPIQQSSYTPVINGQPGQMMHPNNQMIKMKKREMNQKQAVVHTNNIKRRKTGVISHPSSQSNGIIGANGSQGEMIPSHGRVGPMQSMAPSHMGGGGQAIQQSQPGPHPHPHPHPHSLPQQQSAHSTQVHAQQYHSQQQQHPQHHSHSQQYQQQQLHPHSHSQQYQHTQHPIQGQSSHPSLGNSQMQMSMQQMPQQKYNQYHSQQIPHAKSSQLQQQQHMGNHPYQQSQGQQYHAQPIGMMQGQMTGPEIHGGSSGSGGVYGGQGMMNKRGGGVQSGGGMVGSHSSAQMMNAQGSHGTASGGVGGGMGGGSSSSVGGGSTGGGMSGPVNGYMGYSGVHSRAGEMGGMMGLGEGGMGSVMGGSGSGGSGVGPPVQVSGSVSHRISGGGLMIHQSSQLEGQRYSNASSAANSINGGGATSGTTSGIPSNENSISGLHGMGGGAAAVGVAPQSQQSPSMHSMSVSNPVGYIGGSGSELWTGSGANGGGSGSDLGVGGLHMGGCPPAKPNPVSQHYGSGELGSGVGGGVQVVVGMEEGGGVNISGTGGNMNDVGISNTGGGNGSAACVASSNMNNNIADNTNVDNSQ